MMTTRIDQLRQDGIALVPPMPRTQALETLAFLTGRGSQPGHVTASPAQGVSCWTMDDVLRAPYLFEYALAFTDVARDYLARPPVLYSLNAFTTYAGDGATLGYIQEFHRDKDDDRFVALFVYLTDVLEPRDGAHQFQDGTHLGSTPGRMTTVIGPAGTGFLADTSGLHRGLRPVTGSRTLAWARWGVSEHPIAYDWDRLSPSPRAVLGERYPSDPWLQASIRLVVA